MKVVLWVQHLLGTGHTVRAVALGQALRKAGAEVTLVCGARPPQTLSLHGLNTVSLPPVHATDASFNTIVSPSGAPYEAVAGERAALLLKTLERAEPDIFLTETFPFGRRRFGVELLPALKTARAHGTRIVASIRDVLVRKPPDKAAAMVALARAHYDLVLVHADPRFVALGDSFEEAGALNDLLCYTGFVDGGAKVVGGANREGVVISAGGSTVGEVLLRAGLEAARGLTGVPFRILVPHALSQVLPELQRSAPSNVVIELNRPDFRELLCSAALSVSQAGYNTVLDVLAAAPRAIFAPFAQHEETEQTDRARALEARGLATALAEATLTASTLQSAIVTALDAPLPERPIIDTDGAARSASILLNGDRGL